MRGLNMTQVYKIGKMVLNVGSSLYVFKEMGFFDKPNCLQKKNNIVTNYYDVINVIVKSNMLDSDKETLVEIVDNNKDVDYYKTVANIVESNMLASTKIELITTMNYK